VQLIAIFISSIYAFGFTYGMLWLINLFTPVRMTAEEENKGLDSTLHGEEAYAMDTK
jgi:Amt family ammonium transporter